MSAAQIMGLVASGQATSLRISRLLGWAPSTVSSHVQELLDAGLLEESGEGRSRGGRRPRLLSIRAGDGGAPRGRRPRRSPTTKLAVMDRSGRPQNGQGPGHRRHGRADGSYRTPHAQIYRCPHGS